MFRRTLFVLLLAAPLAMAGEKYRDTRTEVHPLTPGGTLHVQMNVGDVEIVKGSDSQNVHLRYTIRTDREANLQKVKVDYRTDSGGATLAVDTPFRGETSVDVELEVPDPTALDVRLKVGDVRIEGIHGNKDVSVKVGDVELRGTDLDFRWVDARTMIGDVSMDRKAGHAEFNHYHESGWLGGKLRCEGAGHYELRARVDVGDIEIR